MVDNAVQYAYLKFRTLGRKVLALARGQSASSSKSLGLSPKLYSYVQSVSLRESDLLGQLRQETAHLPMGAMQVAPEEGQFMALLAQLIGAKKTLEIGVFTGYSTLALALALPPDGKIVACDISEDYTAIARRYWQAAGIDHKIDLHLAPALHTLDQLLAEGHANTFDFVFIDADKENYAAYYERSLTLLRPGGVVAVDNVLWFGSVADSTKQDDVTVAIRNLNQKISQDSRVNISLLTIGDGLTLAMKKL